MNDSHASRAGTTRRQFLAATGGASLAAAFAPGSLAAAPASVNLAPFASATASFSSTRRKLRAINSGYEPRSSRDKKREAYDSWPHKGAEWLQYEWPEDISTNRAEIYWLADGWDVALPSEYDGPLIRPVEPERANERAARAGPNIRRSERLRSRRR